MKKFKQYIYESPIFNDVEKEPGLTPYSEGPKNSKRRKILSNFKGHTVSKLEYDGGSHYGLHEPSGKISFGMFGKERNGKFYAENMNGFSNKIPAHEILHHLITQHGVHYYSDYSQSPGAKKVLEKVHKMPGIRTKAFNMGTREYHDIPKENNLDNYYGKDKGNYRITMKKDENS